MSREEIEARRLQGFYSAMSNEEFQELLGDRAALTVVAQRAVEAEAGVRGFVLPADEVPPVPAPDREPLSEQEQDWVGLISFTVMTEALQASQLLEEQHIPFLLEDEHHRAGSGLRSTQYNVLYLSVPKERRAEALALLKRETKLFPVAEVDARGVVAEDDQADLFRVGDFETDEDAEIATAALAAARVWFKAEKCSVEADENLGTPAGERTFVDVRMEDMERAAGVIETAFLEG